MGILILIFIFFLPGSSQGAEKLYFEKEYSTKEDSIRYTRIVNVVKEVTPTVVSITIIQEKEVTMYSPFDDPFFDRFFGDIIPPRKYKYKVRALGSGVIISPDGYILTNSHVVENATNIKVTLTTGKEYQGEVIAKSPELDLALIKIKTDNLAFAYIGDSKKTMIGETVIAIGNPFGYLLSDSRPSVSVGVISAVDRTVKAREDRLFVNMIQTDAAINPGNSGGPLVNLLGEVVGINTFIFTKSGGSEGIGFAIPSNTVKKFLEKVRTNKLNITGWIGIYVQNLDYKLKQTLQLEENGIIITDVDKNSPADKSNIVPGDVILSVDNNPVTNEIEWESISAFSSPGDTINLVIFRQGSKLEKQIIVEKASDTGEKYYSKILGVEVRELKTYIRKKYGVYSEEGVIITSIKKGARGATIGLNVGDVILKLDGKEIKNLYDFKMAEKNIKRYIEIIGERRGSIFHIRIST